MAEPRDSNQATVRIRAERRMGEMLKGAEKNTGVTGIGPPAALRSRGSTAIKLSDIGISKNMSSRAQSIADIPESEFEAVIAEHNAAHHRSVQPLDSDYECRLRAVNLEFHSRRYLVRRPNIAGQQSLSPRKQLG